MSIVPTEMRALAPNTQSSQFFCDNVQCTAAYTRCPTTTEDDAEFSWCIRCQCSICNKVWWLCRTCHLRVKILKRANLLRHHYANHGANTAVAKTRGKRIIMTKKVATSKKKRALFEVNDDGTLKNDNDNLRKNINESAFDNEASSCEHGSVYDVERVDNNMTIDNNSVQNTSTMPPPPSPSLSLRSSSLRSASSNTRN